MSVIDKLKATREKYLAEMTANNQMGNSKNYKGSNELDLCGDRNLGMTMGVFVSDVNDVPYRIIKNYRSFRINREIAEKYDIKDFRLRICDPSEYLDSVSDEDKRKIAQLCKILDSVKENWEGVWKERISKYAPQITPKFTIQYMKVLQRLDSNNTPVQMEPGIKVLTSRTPAYFRAFDDFIQSTQVTTGGYDFLTDMLSKDSRERKLKYCIKSSRPQFYSFVITSVPAATELTDDDIKQIHDLNTEVIDITQVDSEALSKWIRMFHDENQAIKEGVYKGSVEPQPEPQPEPAPWEAPSAPEEVPDPFG